MKLKACFLFLLLNYFCAYNFAQNTIEFRQLHGDNVPTHSITYAVSQDTIGNVWIASEEGILKHNSKFYKIYNSYNGLPRMMGDRIKEVFVDSKQRVWIGSDKGICLYNKNLDVFEYVNSDKSLNPSLVDVIIEDEAGRIWAGGYNGVWLYTDSNEDRKFTRIINTQNVQALCSYNGKIIFGTQTGIFVYDYSTDSLDEVAVNYEQKNIRYLTVIDNNIFAGTKTGKLFNIDDTKKQGVVLNLDFELNDAVTDIIKLESGGYVIATDGDGIYRLSNDFKIIDHFTEDPNDPFSITSNGVYDILLGNEGIWWVATYGGGLNYLNSSEIPFQNIRHKINDDNSIITNFTRAIARDKNSKIWFGTKKGISIWEQKTNSWHHIKNLSKSDSDKDSDVIVLSLEADGDHMWAGTYNEGLFKININTYKKTHCNSTISDNLLDKVYAIYKDSNNNIWVGGIEKDLAVISPSNQVTTYPIQQIKSITETKQGDILVSGRNGVHKINNHLKTFGLIENLNPNKNSLAYSTINVTIENYDNLILATNGEGLLFYNTLDNSIKRLNVSSGMPSDIIQGVIPIDKNNLWASTTKGLANIVFKDNDTIINVYDKRDGLASTEFNYGSFKDLGNGTIAFGGVDGVTFFEPNNIRTESFEPQLVFDVFKLSNKSIGPGQEPLKNHIDQTHDIVLNHTDNSIEIQFTGVSHSSASKVKYSWFLEGFDTSWSVPSSTNFATYTNLNPGNYTFKVKAKNKYGDFGDERQLNITINAPWWASNKAYIIYFLAFLGLLYAIIHFTTVINNKKNADEQIDFFNNITHEIKTPLTILISSLDNVTESVSAEEDSKNRIKTTVKRINSLFEQMLNFQKVTSDGYLEHDVSKLDVFAHVQQRINNFKPLTQERNITIEFNNQWNEDFYFDKDNFDKIILNLLSNAIKYSFENGLITIETSKTRNQDLKIEISDEGLGIPKDQQKYILKRYFRARNVINSQRPGTGLGLMMVKKLLEKTGGSISFESEENKGTTFTLLIKNLKNQFKGHNELIDGGLVSIPADELEDNTELTEFSDSKILIVEDNDELRDLLVNILGNLFQVYEARNGREGLEMASTIFPDIILTDLIMPELDGMQMSKKLKDDINLNHIPVFMLTVLQNSEQKLESIETGISEYIEKPVDIKYLLAKIINTLKWQQKLRLKYIHDGESDNAEIFRNKSDQQFLNDLENTIIENIENNTFSVHDLSKSFGMSRTSLYMKLKNLVDLSPQDFVIHTKLKHSKKLLIKGEHSIKEVAYQSGFSNPKYFSTSFKKFYGMTPSGFLDSLKKE